MIYFDKLTTLWKKMQDAGIDRANLVRVDLSKFGYSPVFDETISAEQIGLLRKRKKRSA